MAAAYIIWVGFQLEAVAPKKAEDVVRSIIELKMALESTPREPAAFGDVGSKWVQKLCGILDIELPIEHAEIANEMSKVFAAKIFPAAPPPSSADPQK